LILSLPNQPSPGPPPDPTTPPTLTNNILNNNHPAAPLSVTPLESQTLPQLFLVQLSSPSSDTYTISHLTSRHYLFHSKATTPNQPDPDPVTLSLTSQTLWKIQQQNAGGYSIFDADDPTKVISTLADNSLACVNFIPDGPQGDATLRQLQRWQMRRTGKSIQLTFILSISR
jgi:hypothetical protein